MAKYGKQTRGNTERIQLIPSLDQENCCWAVREFLPSQSQIPALWCFPDLKNTKSSKGDGTDTQSAQTGGISAFFLSVFPFIRRETPFST